MIISVRCAICGNDYKRTVFDTNGCPSCGSEQELDVPYSDCGGYITLDTSEEEELSYKKYVEHQDYLHFGKP